MKGLAQDQMAQHFDLHRRLECPQCGHLTARPHARIQGLYWCSRCGHLHGSLYGGEWWQFRIQSGFLTDWCECGGDEAYFDVLVLGSERVRRHGWYCRQCGRLSQAG